MQRVQHYLTVFESFIHLLFPSIFTFWYLTKTSGFTEIDIFMIPFMSQKMLKMEPCGKNERASNMCHKTGYSSACIARKLTHSIDVRMNEIYC